MASHSCHQSSASRSHVSRAARLTCLRSVSLRPLRSTQVSKESDLGGAPFWTFFNSQEHLASREPYQVVLEAFRAGMNAIDVSPFYGESEAIVGSILNDRSFVKEWPRDSYTLITKCGRYGVNKIDYSPARIRKSIANSQLLLHTYHFDVMYMHDAEFVAEDVGNATADGFPLDRLKPEKLAEYGLAPEQADKIWGKGDETVLEAVKTLFELKEEGLIRHVGISGGPLATLLRLARLIRARLGRPLDIIQTYAHLTLQNESLLAYIPLFREAGVKQLVNASILATGLLVYDPPGDWHPAPKALQEATNRVLPNQTHVALRYGLRAGLPHKIPACIGVSSLKELREAIAAFWDGAKPTAEHEKEEAIVRRSIADAGFTNFFFHYRLKKKDEDTSRAGRGS